MKEEQGGGGYLRSKEHLQKIIIDFKCGEEYGSKESELALLEEMQPHHDVKTLKLKGYHGETLPRWPRRGDKSGLFDLPNLVTLKINDCRELLYLPWQVGKLPHLKTLDISDSLSLEYVVVADSQALISGEDSSLFASLENLNIYMLPELKGWCWRSDSGSQLATPNDSGRSQEVHLQWVSSPCFPLLENLTIQKCGKVMSVPLCPQLERLGIKDSRRKLLWSDNWSHPCYQPSSSLSSPQSKQLSINNLELLKSMPSKYTQFLIEIEIVFDMRLESLGEVNELSPTCLFSALQFLTLLRCPKLKSMGGWLEHLSALKFLHIEECPKVVLGGMSWHNIAGTLQTLGLAKIEEMEELPEGMQFCTSLSELFIKDWPKLKSMPKWMPKLTSLQKLTLWGCSEMLKGRCQQPYGEDWPLIRHISEISVR